MGKRRGLYELHETGAWSEDDDESVSSSETGALSFIKVGPAL